MEAFLVMGAPGAGKSTYVTEKFRSYYVISCDSIREKKYGYVRSFEIRQKVLQDILLLIELCINLGVDFVIDTTYFNDKDSRQRLVDLGFSKFINVIFIDTPLEKCLKNNLKRKQETRVVDESILEMLYGRISFPTIFDNFCSLKRISLN
mgnify:CR=1 FL=1|tara:strand:- start:192 stop:641 length:450 start_codon:yes stop_codon:yes gene_type:complete